MSGERCVPHSLMDPLQELYEFFDAQMMMGGVQQKPQFQMEPPSAMGVPGDLNQEPHPIDMQRQAVDMGMQQGMAPEIAHQQVFGDVNLGDQTSKADFASTLGRVQQNFSKKGINIEPTSQSLLAQDSRLEKEKYGQPEEADQDVLRTPVRQQVPHSPTNQADPAQVQAGLTMPEEYDYNLDVAYLQKYGRA